MQIEPYLNFDGRCDEAIEFYKLALGAQVEMLMRFKQSPEPHGHGPEVGEKVMHSSLKIGQSRMMVSDGYCKGGPKFQGIAMSLTVASPEEAAKVFGALSIGGKINMPLTKTFFSPSFGMLDDKFGVGWMIMAASPSPES
jgi:PhnB protein